jgi:hypothetical protein
VPTGPGGDSDADARHPVVGDRLEGEGSMDDVKHTYRTVKTALKTSARGLDGTDLKDRIGNAGDSDRNDLGNLGDDVRTAGRKPRGRSAHTPERPT